MQALLNSLSAITCFWSQSVDKLGLCLDMLSILLKKVKSLQCLIIQCSQRLHFQRWRSGSLLHLAMNLLLWISLVVLVTKNGAATDVSLSTRYKKLLQGVDLNKDFFFSYTYCIMQSVQRNVLSKNDEYMPYENMFVWNAFLSRGIRQRLNNTRWTIALMLGSFEQVHILHTISVLLFCFSLCIVCVGGISCLEMSMLVFGE